MFSTQEKETIESSFEKRCDALGKSARELLVIPAGSTADETLCLKYLYAFMPVSDIASVPWDTILRYVRHALQVRDRMPWGKDVPNGLFLNYVLHYRVNNEIIEVCRDILFEDIWPRIEGKSMKEAALAINYWCLGKATYRPSDERTASPLAVMRTAYGRCGEESVLTVSAMRSAGIPARQCYVPRWSHCDDNHAWVEVWVDGKWHFMGACEPEPELNRGWFTAAASKAMLVHSRVFSAYVDESEKVQSRAGLVTTVNNIETYAAARLLSVRVTDASKKPVQGVSVRFEIVNYSELFPLAEKTTGDDGRVDFLTGLGDVFLHASKDGRFTYRKVDMRSENLIELDFSQAQEETGEVLDFEMVPPEERMDFDTLLSEDAVEAHKAGIASAEAARSRYEGTFHTRETAAEFAEKYATGRERIAEILVLSRGNHPQIVKFLADDASLPLRLKLLDTLATKDYEDLKAEILEEHLRCACVFQNKYPEEIFAPYVLSPRIGFEHLYKYREYIGDHFGEKEKDTFIQNPSALYEYVESHIEDCKGMDYATLISSPAGLLKLGTGSAKSRKTLFVAICRTLGVPARLNPVTKEPEYFSGKGWVGVPDREEGGKETESGKGGLVLCKKDEETITYMQHFSIGKLENGVFNTLDYSAVQWDKNRFCIETTPGWYRVVLSGRQIDGSVLVRLTHVRVEPGQSRQVLLETRQEPLEKRLKNIPLEDLTLSGQKGAEERLKEMVSGVPASILAILDVGTEPTEHLLNELCTLEQQIAQSRVPLIFIVGGPNDFSNGTLEKALRAIPSAKAYTCGSKGYLAGLFKQLKMGDHRLPLSMVLDGGLHGRFAFSNYNVGTADLLLQIAKTIKNG